MPPELKRRRFRRVLGLAILLVSMGAVVTVALTDVGPEMPFQSGRGGATLNVHDNLVVDRDGDRFIFKIATVYFLPFYLAADGTADPSVAASSERLFTNRAKVMARIKELGGNTIRVPMGSAVYRAGEDPYELGGRDAIIERLGQLVDEADSLGLKVMPSWWDATGAGEEFADRYTDAFPMMRAAMEEIGSRDNVVFEPWNEPNGIDWGAWETISTATVKFFRTELQYDDLLILDTINYSWAFSADYAKRLQKVDETLLGLSNLAFANHRYANADTCFCDEILKSWEEEVGSHVGTFPIIGTEYGYWNRDWKPSPTWNAQLVAHLIKKTEDGLNGYGAFTWNWVDLNTMTRDDLTTLTSFGTTAVSYWAEPFAGLVR